MTNVTKFYELVCAVLPYKVEIACPGGWGNRPSKEQYDWCHANIGPDAAPEQYDLVENFTLDTTKGWTWMWTGSDTKAAAFVFHFASELHAVEFKLKFG